MPRRNNRRHYRHEGELGFNPKKYITGSGYRPASLPKYAVCISYENRPAANRHKAQNYTAKKRRAMQEIRQLERKTEQIVLLESNSHTQTITPIRLPVTQADESQQPHNIIISIIGGIKNWIKAILLT